MNELKHAPGPWYLIKEDGLFPTVAFIKPDTTDKLWRHGTPRVIVNESPQRTDEEIYATAQLIAAAPSMLADLQRILAMSEDTGREGCKWGETEYDSLSVAHGYNLALRHVKSYITSIRNLAE